MKKVNLPVDFIVDISMDCIVSTDVRPWGRDIRHHLLTIWLG